MQYNKNPISLREGHALIDGVEVMDGVKMTINFTPETWTGRQLNETTPSTRWVGATITGSMTRRRTNNWLKTKIKEYQATKATPEFVIQGIMDDAIGTRHRSRQGRWRRCRNNESPRRQRSRA